MSEAASQAYVGNELELFAHAVRWKTYLRSCIQPHLRGSVLEVGAGNGNNTRSLLEDLQGVSAWTSLEPDAKLAGAIRGLKLPNGTEVSVRVGTTASLAADERFDTVIYLDVLEHIEADAEELRHAAVHLRPGGRLVVLSPAHQFLFSPFDAAIGHFRRYSRGQLRATAPAALRPIELRYLDSVGFFASLANRLLMRQAMPSLGQIQFWDGVLVRLSRVFDPLSGFQFGKSVLGVWEKTLGVAL